jgi:ATP-binding cassette subfamily B protein
MRDRTTIIIAHRLSTIALADDVVVIDDGRVLVADGRTSAVYREIEQHGMLERIFQEDVA